VLDLRERPEWQTSLWLGVKEEFQAVVVEWLRDKEKVEEVRVESMEVKEKRVKRMGR
jgi:hypothetical protein